MRKLISLMREEQRALADAFYRNAFPKQFDGGDGGLILPVHRGPVPIHRFNHYLARRNPQTSSARLLQE